MGRVNYGRHVIISTETHAALKKGCQEAGVLMTDVCDTIMAVFIVELKKKSIEERTAILREIAAGKAFADAFKPFAELIKLAAEGGTIVDKSGDGKIVTPEKQEGPAQGPPQ